VKRDGKCGPERPLIGKIRFIQPISDFGYSNQRRATGEPFGLASGNKEF
jgi:hypothetical protein